MPAPGDAVRLEMTKWGGGAHWAYDAVLLGADEHGDWLGIPAGTPISRPGRTFTASVDHVSLVPRAVWWAAAFYGPGHRIHTYVDMTTVPAWDGAVVRAVDLDLDVVRLTDGTTWVDDEDEFAEHRVQLGYPAEVVAAAEASAASVLDAVRHQVAPFDGSAAPWLAALAELTDRRGGATGR